jgi:high-affinity K+ transport system ATPase subunit B
MKQRLITMWKSGRQSAVNQADRALEHTCAGRVVSALTFIVVVVSLGFWITAFLLFRNQLFTHAISANVFNNLTCIIFFGGLVLAVFVGAMAGNFLRRTFWKLLVKRYK